jgi:hypothetical protein
MLPAMKALVLNAVASGFALEEVDIARPADRHLVLSRGEGETRK